MSIVPQDFVYFILVTVLLRYTVSTLVLDIMDRYVKRWLIKTERDAIYWLHYHGHAAKQGHRSKHPFDCDDEACKKVTR